MKDDVRLAKWLNDEMDEKELEEFMSSPEYATYSRIKEFSAQLTAPEGNIDSIYQKIKEQRQRPVKQVPVRKLSAWLPRIAALFIIAFGLAWFFYTSHTTTQVANAGKRTTFMLPDNSKVVLNAASEADYKTWNWDDNRRVELEGEAWFKVAKGKTFDVVTPQGTVTVVGTQFNVKEREGRFEVTCFEGKVKVTSNNQEVLLTPGKSVVFENGKKTDLPAREEIKQPGWINYKTYFNSENIKNIVKEMERQYNIEIVLMDNISKADLNRSYTGQIPMDDLDSAIETIEPIYHVRAKKQGSKIILSGE
ncbi:FecR family protein [Flavobacterium rhizosphaerae]|uniref:FecR family protein n=1 Tax=Flavobacterium rhizosphaerae TaxID=3163298 RepID=A0ABW8YX38_9FLAO